MSSGWKNIFSKFRNKLQINEDTQNPSVKHTQIKPTQTQPPSHPKKTEERDPDEPVIDDEARSDNERLDPASKCAPIVIADEFKEHLDLNAYDFSKVDAYARATPEAETESIARLSKYLTSKWDSQLDKLRCVFVWIADNIVYDVDVYFSGNIGHCSAEDTLRTRKGVCDGYAELFDALGGSNVWKITGKAKGAGYVPGVNIEGKQHDHAWNGVNYKGEFLLVDSTWGAGILNNKHFEKRFEPFYFLTRPTQFIYTHFPNDPKQQYVSPQLTKAEFLDLTHVKPPFFGSGLGFRKHYGNCIEIDDDKIELEITREYPDESKPLHAVLEWKGKSYDVLTQRIVGVGSKKLRVYKLQTSCPSGGEGKLNIFVMLGGNTGPLAASLKVVNTGTGKNHKTFAKTYNVPFSVIINSPLHSKLAYNEDIKFEFSVLDMKEEEHPQFFLFTPEKQTRPFSKTTRYSDGTITYAIDTCIDQKGDWNLTYSQNKTNFSFIAQYCVE